MNEIQRNQINSAEMTAYWRTSESIISNDSLSVNLVSQEGINNAHTFVEKLNYHCVSRLISVRARYFFDQAVQLLKTGKYDSCISLASGFSLLNDNILNTNEFNEIKFYDSDLAHVIQVRKNRMDTFINKSNIKFHKNNKTITLDLNDLLFNNTFKEIFTNVKNPLIILEGISYFISSDVLNILFKELSLFKHAAIILDYFPENSATRSEHFRKHAKNVTSFIPEIINTIKTDENNYLSLIKINNHISVQEYENQICKMHGLKTKLTDENIFFPTQFIVFAK